jgi:hypothetical protein
MILSIPILKVMLADLTMGKLFYARQDVVNAVQEFAQVASKDMP